MPAKRLKSEAARQAAVFAALGDETRLRLITHLTRNSPLSIARLTSGSKISRQAITKHLHVLSRAGLVRGLQKGRERLYECDTRQLDSARAYLEIITREWEAALGRLKALVEQT